MTKNNHPSFNDFFDVLRAYSFGIKNDRTKEDIYKSLVEERAEFDDEYSGKGNGVDGVVGEGIDEMLGLSDLIFFHKPDITKQEFYDYVFKKLEKWRVKYSNTTFEEILAQMPKKTPCDTVDQHQAAKDIVQITKNAENDADAEKRILSYLKNRNL